MNITITGTEHFSGDDPTPELVAAVGRMVADGVHYIGNNLLIGRMTLEVIVPDMGPEWPQQDVATIVVELSDAGPSQTKAARQLDILTGAVGNPATLLDSATTVDPSTASTLRQIVWALAEIEQMNES